MRIYDPCYAASAILSESFELDNPDKLKKWIEIFREIMYGYDAVAKLTESEKEAIPYVLLANQFIATSWFADKDKYKDILTYLTYIRIIMVCLLYQKIGKAYYY